LTDGCDCGFVATFDEDDVSAGDEVARVREARVLSCDGTMTGNIRVGQPAAIEVIYDVRQKDPAPRINLHLTTEEGTHAFASIENTGVAHGPGRYRAIMEIPENFLNSKSYYVSIYVSSFDPTRVHAMLRDVLVLNIIDDPASVTRQRYQGSFPGVIRPALNWSVTSI
jgi:hypothetical protein